MGIIDAIKEVAQAIRNMGGLPGQCVQEVGTSYDAVYTGTTQTPNDDTIPQNTEGTEFFSQAITPRAVGNILHIEVNAMISHTAVPRVCTFALHQDSVVNALAAHGHTVVFNTDAPNSVTVRFRVVVTSTSPTTYKIRIGAHSTGTLTINGAGAGSRLYGAIPKSSITIKECRPL